MKIHITYFGMLAEITQCNSESFLFSNTTVQELLDMLWIKYPSLKDTEFKVAQDNILLSEDAVLGEGEIALLPPFSGG